LVTRAVVSLYLLTLLPTLLPLSWLNDSLVESAALCVAPLHSSPSPLSLLHRFFVAPLVHTELASGMASCFALWIIGTRIEQQRGSVALAQLLATLLLLTQAAHTFLVGALLLQPTMVQQMRERYYLQLDAATPADRLRVPVWGEAPSPLSWHHSTWTSYSIPVQACSVGNAAIVFALIALECCAFTKDRKRLYVPVTRTSLARSNRNATEEGNRIHGRRAKRASALSYGPPNALCMSLSSTALRDYPLISVSLMSVRLLSFSLPVFSLFMLPYPLPTRVMPLVLFALHSLWWGMQLHAFVGLVIGYAAAWMPFLILPAGVLRLLECEWMRGHESFVSVSDAGLMQPWSHYRHVESEPLVSPPAPAAAATGASAASPKLARSSVPVSRPAVRVDAAGGWRRAGAGTSTPIAGRDSPSSSDADISSSDADEAESMGAASINSARTPAVVRSSAGSSASATALAANVAKIIDVSVYPTNAPSETEIQRVAAIDEALQEQT
jgi:hypothetical protein